MFRINDERCFLRYKQNANCKPLPRATGQPNYNESKDASESSFAQQSFLQKDSLLFSSIFSKVLLHFQTVNLNGLTDQNLLVLGLITVSISTKFNSQIKFSIYRLNLAIKHFVKTKGISWKTIVLESYRKSTLC